MNNISKIKECTGCSACIQICPKKCISMVDNQQGFSVAELNNSECILCGLCLNVCPANKVATSDLQKPSHVYAARLASEQILKESTSGGLFFALSEHFLSTDGWIAGCILDENFDPIHICTKDKSLRDLMKGTKYVQSNTEKVLPKIIELLSKNEKVMFFGTPCQVNGLKSLCAKKHLKVENLFTVDIICHGVPSPKIFKDHIAYLEKKYGKIATYKFRDKSLGWRGQNVKIEFENGTVLNNTEDSLSYCKLYFNSLISRDACYNCQYATIERAGDLTIGDFWNIEKINSNFNDNKGVSVVFINTSSGQSMLDNIKPTINLFEVDIEDAMQPSLCTPTKPGWKRNKFWKTYELSGYLKAYNKTKKLTLFDRCLRKIYNVFNK